ncbi:MAG: hypothetical protein KKD38_08940, partial [Candidatus Delongbacteria bacterium]|nr:hypothetical protein [Candidatus Delongbacteria bacterium]
MISCSRFALLVVIIFLDSVIPKDLPSILSNNTEKSVKDTYRVENHVVMGSSGNWVDLSIKNTSTNFKMYGMVLSLNTDPEYGTSPWITNATYDPSSIIGDIEATATKLIKVKFNVETQYSGEAGRLVFNLTSSISTVNYTISIPVTPCEYYETFTSGLTNWNISNTKGWGIGLPSSIDLTWTAFPYSFVDRNYSRLYGTKYSTSNVESSSITSEAINCKSGEDYHTEICMWIGLPKEAFTDQYDKTGDYSVMLSGQTIFVPCQSEHDRFFSRTDFQHWFPSYYETWYNNKQYLFVEYIYKTRSSGFSISINKNPLEDDEAIYFDDISVQYKPG